MFKSGINLQELVSTGVTIEVDPQESECFEKDGSGDEEVSNEEYQNELLKHINLNCIGEFDDEDSYDCEPFSQLESKMTDVCDGVKKRVLRDGYGEQPNDKCIVKVHYNGYLEYCEQPFDCTYARKRPQTFVVNSGEVLPGLDIAVQSMQLNEKSQFLVKPHLAYGSFGCLDRIPPNASILFEIELLEIIDSSAAENYGQLSDDQKKQFSEVYKFCTSQCAKAKDLFHRNVSSAIKEYNIAVEALERAQLDNYDDQLKQQEMRWKLYSNLLVCHTKMEQPKKGCMSFNKLNELARGTELKLNAKAYFNNAKCLKMLGEFNLAKKRLQKAHELEPRNPEILAEIQVIDCELKKYKEKERKLAAAFAGGNVK